MPEDITISIQELSIVCLIVAPFIMCGWTYFARMWYLRFAPLHEVRDSIDATWKSWSKYGEMSQVAYYTSMVILPVLEELFFRLLPFWIADYYFENSFTWMIILILGFQILFGLVYWVNNRSVIVSLLCQGLVGVMLCLVFWITACAFGSVIAVVALSGVHLAYNFLFAGLIFKPLHFPKEDYFVESSINANRLISPIGGWSRARTSA